MEPADPPPKKYDLKPREFKRDNAPADALPPMPTARDLAIISGQRAPTGPKPTAGPRPGDPNDVHVVLQQNRAAEQRMGLGDVEIKKVRSRRKRDYWLLLGPCVLLLGVITWQGRHNPFFLVGGLSGIVVVTLGITWIMWHVMDNY